MALDLAKIDTPAASEIGTEIELIYNDKPTGWFVTVRGEHSSTVKKWLLNGLNKLKLKEWQDQRKGKNEGPSKMTEEDLQFGLNAAAIRVVSFRGIIFAKKPFEFSEENAYDLVRRHPPFADQILEASNDLSNFTKPQPEN